MMKLLHCGLVMLNLFFVTGHEDIAQIIFKKLENEDNLNKIKDMIVKRVVEDKLYHIKNDLRHRRGFKKKPEHENDGLMLLSNEWKNIKAQQGQQPNKIIQKVSMKYKSNDDAKIIILYDDDVVMDNKESRRYLSTIWNFVKRLLGFSSTAKSKIQVKIPPTPKTVKKGTQNSKPANNINVDASKVEINEFQIVSNVTITIPEDENSRKWSNRKRRYWDKSNNNEGNKHENEKATVAGDKSLHKDSKEKRPRIEIMDGILVTPVVELATK